MVDSDSSQPAVQTREQRGLALKKARTGAGLTAMDLAQRVNDRTAGSDITHHAIYSYERGKVLLSREVGLRIAQTLNLHPGELLVGDPDFATAPPSRPPSSPPSSPPAPHSASPSDAHAASGGESGSAASAAADLLQPFHHSPYPPPPSNQPPMAYGSGAQGSAGYDAAGPWPAAPTGYPPPTHATPPPDRGGRVAGAAVDSPGSAAPGPGPTRALRIALSKSARTALPVGNVLYRLLDTAQIGQASMHGYLDVFTLLIRDLQTTLHSPAGQEVRTLGLGEGNDVPYQLLRTAAELHGYAQHALRHLLSFGDPRDAALYDACTQTRDQLGPRLRLLEKHIRHNDRGLVADDDTPPLLPQVPNYPASHPLMAAAPAATF